MATEDLFATEDRSGSYFALPAPAIEGAIATPRKLVRYLDGEQTLDRSSNPEGYLIPDIDWSLGIGWQDGTFSPEPAGVEMHQTGLVVHLLSGEDEFSPVIRQNQPFGVSTLSFIGHQPALGRSWDHIGKAPPAFGGSAMGLIGAGATVMSVVEESGPGSSASDLATEMRPDASVAEIASRINGISGLTDQDLARLFRVARETFQRWRTGELTNPTQANRRRLGLLLRLLQDLNARDIQVGQWLRNISVIDDLTPYELLERGRLDDVENLAARLIDHRTPPRTEVGVDGSPRTRVVGLPAFARRDEEPAEDLVLNDDDDWVEIETEAVEDDE